jgi:hypothetical protein
MLSIKTADNQSAIASNPLHNINDNSNRRQMHAANALTEIAKDNSATLGFQHNVIQC